MSTAVGPCWGVVPAAGIGSRMGRETPKQYLMLGQRTILEHSVQALLSCSFVEAVVVALHPEDTKGLQLQGLDDPRVIFTTGGDNRSDSVLAGLNVLSGRADDDDWVLVHDAARPCVLASDIERLFDTVSTTGVGGILAEPVMDTVKQADRAGRVQATLDRSTLWRAQTPQMFRFSLLQTALEQALASSAPVTDEASAMELAGHSVQLVAGSANNLKITVPADISLAEFYLRSRTAQR
ncbi:MAG: 2-C-methyl-D-erythritol 4-phosphate cytidylyltransferase [Halioglobus sp.]